MTEQGRKLMAMINTVVNSLDALGPILGTIEALGRRHVAYGVTEAHYKRRPLDLLRSMLQRYEDFILSEIKALLLRAAMT